MDAKLELLLWLILSLLLSIVAVNAAYRLEGGRLLQLTEESAMGVLAREFGYFFVMVGIPFVALITGASGLDLMALGADLAKPGHIAGFTFADWVRGAGVAAVVIICILVILWLGSRAAPHGQRWNIGLLGVRDALYDEVHWTFLRAAPFLLFGDPYWGVLIGALLVLLEWVTHPDAGEWLKSIEGRQYLTVRLACLFASGFLYLATRNLWLMIVANLVIQLAGSRVLGMSRGERQNAEIRD
jgi:hypothetical protein